MTRFDPGWLGLLLWAVPAMVLAGMYIVVALAVSPVLVPYLAIRRDRGGEAANRFAEAVVSLLVVLACAYQLALWLRDPASFFVALT